MQGQMSIFDFLTVPGELDTIPEEEMVDKIGNALGVIFKYNDFFGDYRAKIGKTILTLQYDNYFQEIDNGARFISADIGNKHAGAGAPCDSIDETIRFFRRWLQKERTAESVKKENRRAE